MHTSLRPDIKFSQDLSADSLSYTTSIARRNRVQRITFTASVPITETIVISLDSGSGASYDVVLRTKSLSAESNFVYEPTGGYIDLYAGDEIKITCTNANLTGTIYGAIKSREIPQ